AWDSELRIASDINVNNTIALHNTRMIQTFVAIDARVRPFVMAIKHWSKCRELNDAAFGGTLSPYAWVNLAINFLQTRQPPILPVIHPPASSLSAKDSMHGSELNLTFNDDIDQLRGFGLTNTESLGYLLYAFFRTYAFEFDYRHQVVSLRHGCFLTKEQKGWDTGRPSRIFCIEEPFSTWLNLGHSANTTSVEGIRQEFQRAFIILRDGGSYDEACETYQRPQRDLSSTTPDLPPILETDLSFTNGAVRRVAEEALVQPVSFHAADNQSQRRHQRRHSARHSTSEAIARSPVAGAMPTPVGVQRRESHDGLAVSPEMGRPNPNRPYPWNHSQRRYPTAANELGDQQQDEAIPGLLSGYVEASANVCGRYTQSAQDVDEHHHSFALLSSKFAQVSVCSPDEANR
ncbi:hypothetical protein GGI16_001245, partial [Coemansia sp. S142-1]